MGLRRTDESANDQGRPISTSKASNAKRASAQDQIGTTATPRLTRMSWHQSSTKSKKTTHTIHVSTTKATTTTTTIDDDNNKFRQDRPTVLKQNFSTQQEVDPHFVQTGGGSAPCDTLRLTILCRTAPLVRQGVLSKFHQPDQYFGLPASTSQRQSARPERRLDVLRLLAV